MRTGDAAEAVGADLLAVETIGDALVGSGKPFVSASGTLTLVSGGHLGVATETDEMTTATKRYRN